MEQQELECVARHLNAFIKTHWHQNPAEACEDCPRHCKKEADPGLLDPWPAFAELGRLTGIRFTVCAGPIASPDSVLAHPEKDTDTPSNAHSDS